MVIFSVADPSSLLASVEGKGDLSAWQRKLAKQIRWTRSLYDGDAGVMPFMYGMDLVYFTRAIERYSRDPVARSELVPRGAVSGERVPGNQASLGHPA